MVALAYVALAVVWGSTFVFAKVATGVVTPEQTALLRVAFGLLPVVAYGLARGAFRRAHVRHAHHFLVMALLGTVLQYTAFSAGSAVLPSGVAGALAGSVPLFALLAAVLLLPQEKISAGALAGVLVALGGVVLLGRPWDGGSVDAGGVGWMLAGSCAVGLSFVYAKRFLADLDIHPAALTSYQLGIGTVTLFVVTDLDGIGAVADDGSVLAGTLLGLGLLGTGVAYLLYYALTAQLGAVAAASSTYPPPIVALLIGWLFAGEAIGPLDGVAGALVLGGVVATTGLPRRPRSQRHVHRLARGQLLAELGPTRCGRLDPQTTRLAATVSVTSLEPGGRSRRGTPAGRP